MAKFRLVSTVLSSPTVNGDKKENLVREKESAMPFTQLKQRSREDYRYCLEYRTRWSDNDMYDHMNNSVYSFLFDSIINAYLIEHCGLRPSTSSQIGLVVHSHCDHFGSVGFPSMLDLGLRVNKLGTSSVMYEVGVFERGKGNVRAVGGYTHVFVERQTNRPAACGMSEEIRRGLEKLLLDEMPKL